MLIEHVLLQQVRHFSFSCCLAFRIRLSVWIFELKLNKTLYNLYLWPANNALLMLINPYA